MLLSLAPVGEICSVKGVWADTELRDVLEGIGFTSNCEVVVVSKPSEDILIVGIQNRRIVIGEELARKIMV